MPTSASRWRWSSPSRSPTVIVAGPLFGEALPDVGCPRRGRDRFRLLPRLRRTAGVSVTSRAGGGEGDETTTQPGDAR